MDTLLTKYFLFQTNSMNGATPSAPVTSTVVPTPSPASPKESAPAIKTAPSKEDNIAKMKNMTSDFWSQM